MTVSKTKAKLVDVARHLFAKMGVENTTMNDIALASKKGDVYKRQDNIVQDWEYWGDKPQWNSLTFHPANFDHPRQVIEELHQQDHVHFMLSVWPGRCV